MIERAATLVTDTHNVLRARQLLDDAAGLQTRAQSLSSTAARLERLSRSASVLRGGGVSLTIPVERVRGVRMAATLVAAAFEMDPKTALSPDTQARFAFWEKIGELTQEMETGLAATWRNHVAQVLPMIEPEILNVLATVPGARQSVAELKATIVEARELERLPERDEDLVRLGTVADRAAGAIAGLGADSVPVAVKAFLRAAAAGQATLQDVTPEVESWLDRWALRGRVRVMLG